MGLAFVLWSRHLPSGAWWWRSAVLGVLNVGAFFAPFFVAAFRLPGGVAATAAAAYANWFRGIQELPISTVSFLGLLSPLVATAIGWVALGQLMAPLQLVGAAFVVIAVVVPQLGTQRFRGRSTPINPPEQSRCARHGVEQAIRQRSTDPWASEGALSTSKDVS